MVPGDDSTRFFDEHGMRVVNAPPGMRFNQLEVVQTTFPPCEVACHAPSLNISFSPFYLPTTAAIGPGWDLRCLHGYASLKRRTVLFAAWHLVRLGWELGGNFPGFCNIIYNIPHYVPSSLDIYPILYPFCTDSIPINGLSP